MSYKKKILGVTLLPSLLLISAQALAYNFVPSLGVNVKNHSDVYKNGTDVEDTVYAPYLGLRFSESNSNINTSVDFYAVYEDYQDNSYSASDLYDVNAFLDWIILPDRFVWAFEDYASTQRINVLGLEVPDNLQTVNVFSTGPDFSYQYEVWSILAKLRYGDIQYSSSKSDGRFTSVSTALRRDINEYSRATGALALRNNDYDAAFLDDYDVMKGFISYSRDLPTGDFLADFGFNRVEYDSGAKEDSPYIKLSLAMRPTGSFGFEVSVQDEIADAISRAYSATESRISVFDTAADSGFLFSPLSDLATAGVYRARDAKAGINYSAGVVKLGLGASSADKDYINARADSQVLAFRGYANFLLTQLLSFTVGGSYQEVDYDASLTDPEINDEITRGYAVVNYRWTETITTGLGFSTEERTSTDATREFANDIIFFSLKYQGLTR
jgi:hypothetical protein